MGKKGWIRGLSAYTSVFNEQKTDTVVKQENTKSFSLTRVSPLLFVSLVTIADSLCVFSLTPICVLEVSAFTIALSPQTSDTNASSSEKKEDGGDKAIVKADTSNTQIGVKENTHSESAIVFIVFSFSFGFYFLFFSHFNTLIVSSHCHSS
jgi:hypothetical protein